VRCSTAPWLSASCTAFVISSTNKNLGAERVWVVHDSDGLDEITTAGPTNVAALENGTVTSFEISPEEVGLPRVKPEYLRGGERQGPVMRHGLVTVAPEDDLSRVMKLMTRHRVRHMPVLRDGKLSGIISIGDVVKHRLDDLELEANILRDAYIAHH
jgi:hypothetical protein